MDPYRWLDLVWDFSPSCHVPFFQISYYSITMILLSVSSSCFTLAVPMREVSCVGYTPRAWDPRSVHNCRRVVFDH